MPRYRKHYECPDCGNTWEDDWDLPFDGSCPKCGAPGRLKDVEVISLSVAEAFTCPTCGEHRLEEILSGATVTSSVEGIWKDGDTEYGEVATEDGTIERFQCVDCGWKVPDCEDTTALFEWLSERLEEKRDDP
jgi:predicted RNA-binding Zn-ribbon protein involved in translation (DUF1610 family)